MVVNADEVGVNNLLSGELIHAVAVGGAVHGEVRPPENAAQGFVDMFIDTGSSHIGYILDIMCMCGENLGMGEALQQRENL